MFQNAASTGQHFEERNYREAPATLQLALLSNIDHSKQLLAASLQINALLVQQLAALHALPHEPACSRTAAFPLPDLPTTVKIEAQDFTPLSESPPKKRRLIGKRMPRPEGESGCGLDKNQTKNIPKNYGKAILSFMQKNIQRYVGVVRPILQAHRLSVGDLLAHIKKHKRQVNSINYLKQMWGYGDVPNPIYKCIRILSYIFMRKHCLSYIFNSRVKNYATHIKYRTRIIEGIERPHEFTCIKQF